MNKIGYILILFLYLWGVYFILQSQTTSESFVSGNCPTTLIKDGNHLFLYDPSMAKVPGVNPIQFKSLEDYKEYIDWQRKSKLKCPILHLEKMCTTQGTHMYEIRQNFVDMHEYGAQPKQVNHILPFDPENQTQGMPDSVALSLALT
jgi:hypothetical protein